MILRHATAADESSIRTCAEEAYTQYIAAIGQKPAPMVADFARQIAEGLVHVAEEDQGDVAGFIVFFPRSDHMFLENIAVRRAAAGQGIGKRLMGLCEETARQLGLVSIQLYTNEKMTQNLSIYPHLGYRETHRGIEDGFHRVYFEKQLT